MARTREFEPEQALEAAMQLFWERGYSDTSMEQLVERTGVSRYGLYSTFGNKWELFLATLEKYERERLATMMAGLRAPNASLAGIEDFFREIVGYAASGAAKNGCLMCNTAAEMGLAAIETTLRVDRYVDTLCAAFAHALAGAIKDGTIPAAADVDGLAEQLTTSTVGLFIMLKGSRSRKMIEGTTRTLLASIPRTP